MTLFKEDGHLHEEGLRALVQGSLNELERLEAAEHMDFCDACLDGYVALLADDALMQPPQEVQAGITRRVRRIRGKTTWARYGGIAAAACLAVVMWGVGSFAIDGLRRAEPSQAYSAALQQPQASEPGFFGKAFASLRNFISGPEKETAADDTADAGQTLLAPEPSVSTAPPPQVTAPTVPQGTVSSTPQVTAGLTQKEREALFEKTGQPVVPTADDSKNGDDASTADDSSNK